MFIHSFLIIYIMKILAPYTSSSVSGRCGHCSGHLLLVHYYSISFHYVTLKPAALHFFTSLNISHTDIYLLSSADLQRRAASTLHRRLRCPQEQLDALRQPGLLARRTEPGSVPERPGHLLLHHPPRGAQTGAAGVVQPGVRPEALRPAGRRQTQ